MMDRPWNRGAYKRLGIKYAGSTPYAPQQKIGWALLALRPTVESEGEIQSDDPFAAAIAMAQKAMADGAEGVDLYRFRTVEAFERSRAASKGMTHAQHDKKIEMLAVAMRAAGIPVNVQMVE